MQPARRALIPLLVALTALVVQASGGAAAPDLPAPARVCVLPAAWHRTMEAPLATRQAWSLPRGETDIRTEDVMIVVGASHAGLY